MKGGDFMGSPDRGPEIMGLGQGKVSPGTGIVINEMQTETHPLVKVVLKKPDFLFRPDRQNPTEQEALYDELASLRMGGGE